MMGAAMSKCIFVTGGVVSLEEKDLASASIGKAWGQS
jgi:CTP synthase (UTP-ammonia lyase)